MRTHLITSVLSIPCSYFIDKNLVRMAVFSSSVMLANALLIIEVNSGQSLRLAMERDCSPKGLAAVTCRFAYPCLLMILLATVRLPI